MNRRTGIASRLSVALLFVAIAAAGCGQHGGDQTQPPASPALTAAASDSAAPISQATPLATETAATGGAGAQATPDPVDTSISGLNQLLNGIDGSLSGSDAGTSGGE